MDSSLTCLVGGSNQNRKLKTGQDPQTSEVASQDQQRAAWAPCFFCRADKEVYHFAGRDISIQGALDSFAGVIWPEALALCHYLDTHHQQLTLLDKAVLELAAGTGLVSIVASLLGAWVTAMDLPETLNNLRFNLSRNTRGYCKYLPRVAYLSWDLDLKQTYPSSIYWYDYVLVASAACHQEYFEEFLTAMTYFCQRGTTLIFAIRVRMESELRFVEDFKRAFHTTLVSDDGNVLIFKAARRENEFDYSEEVDLTAVQRERERHIVSEKNKTENITIIRKSVTLEVKKGKREEEVGVSGEADDCTDDGTTTPGPNNASTTTSVQDSPGQEASTNQVVLPPAWAPKVMYSLGKEIYHYVGEDIVIYETIDSYGAIMWPAALALCSFLENNTERVNLQGAQVLELGAGTGLVSIVASLLGASVTATDLPDVLSNLRANVLRNTRGRCRQLPTVDVLSWGFDLKGSHPTHVHRYDYILAADVVYQHDFLEELLATMKHFCQPGSTVIWANKVRLGSDLTFTNNFKRAFHTSLLFEDGDMKIFRGTCRRS